MSERPVGHRDIAVAVIGLLLLLLVAVSTVWAFRQLERKHMQARHFAEVEAIRATLVNPQIMVPER